ncbi:biotin--[acetyl-CoA-carboxylase] ligase [Sulfurimonas sp.]|uniref:biotin--[acetyl-CoA-carboxylase] ligase n=1 Tax=Sulfurimonas sp. TaxID=2022749 RepID=UPI00262C425C|nr:biotin--[acetyl-CoA-carboxylase] ligase [Sulfurimonas sp.]
MKILSLKSIDSTQVYLKNAISNKTLQAPIAVIANEQTNGIGSRNNSWSSQKGNLFLSFALPLDVLPKDLKLESASIYFAYILKESLAAFGSKVFLKWPNDFYVNDKKVGGMITNIVSDVLVCGVGLNLESADERFTKLDINLKISTLLENYFENLEKKTLWKQVFSKYKLEFRTNNKFFTHNNGMKISLSSAVLEYDGSLHINGERIYSRR